MIKIAKVIDNVDPDELGKIQVRILPEMIDVTDDLLPWAACYQNGIGITDNSGIHKIPEKDSFIRVIVEDWPYMQVIRYISDDYIEGKYIYSKFSDVSIDELEEQTYPQPIFQRFEDGTIEFHNSSTGEHGTYYKNGSYFIHDSSGNLYLNNKDKELKIYNNSGFFQLKTDGSIELNSDKDLDINITGDSTVTTTGNLELKTTANTTIDTTGNTQIKSTGTVNIQGATVTMQGTTNLVSPTGSGPFCALPACLFTGAPHVGSTLS